MLRFGAGLALGLTPFLPPVLFVWEAFYRNAIAYQPRAVVGHPLRAVFGIRSARRWILAPVHRYRIWHARALRHHGRQPRARSVGAVVEAVGHRDGCARLRDVSVPRPGDRRAVHGAPGARAGMSRTSGGRRSFVAGIRRESNSPFIDAELAIGDRGRPPGGPGRIQTFPRSFGRGSSPSKHTIIASMDDMSRMFGRGSPTSTICRPVASDRGDRRRLPSPVVLVVLSLARPRASSAGAEGACCSIARARPAPPDRSSAPAAPAGRDSRRSGRFRTARSRARSWHRRSAPCTPAPARSLYPVPR